MIDHKKKLKKKKRFRGMNREKFFFRIDTVKLKKKRRRLSKFAKQLKTCLVIRKFASQMTVRQFRSYIKKAIKGSSLFFKFINLIESRLDVALFRMNLFESSSQARQFINHGFIIVNGKISCFSSLKLCLGDLFSVTNKTLFRNKIFSLFMKKNIIRSIPAYLEVNFRILTGVFIFSPRPNQIVYPIKIRNTLLSSIGKKF
jgi:small subunit ribosomal protein S4